ncbi:class I glutamine amidotransferase-like protein [Ramicandelaber brevisporus]|nr:class I glutamine amidotransferase-like protein [Ramicandelaber brevisporus]
MKVHSFLLVLLFVLLQQAATVVLGDTPNAAADAAAATTTTAKRSTVLGYVYDEFELLDLFGPLELFVYVPNLDIRIVSADGRPVRSRGGVVVSADYSFDNAPTKPDVFLIPGGLGTWSAANSTAAIDFVKKAAAGTKKMTLSVCTGAALIAKAGVLDGKRATTNKVVFKEVMEYGKNTKWVYHARWVEDGNVISSAGVSAGIDAAAQLINRIWGLPAAKFAVNNAEYVWNTDPNKDDFSGLYPDPTKGN